MVGGTLLSTLACAEESWHEQETFYVLLLMAEQTH
jgi:hypothetical protein